MSQWVEPGKEVEDGHECKPPPASHAHYGAAITHVYETETGLWAINAEYATRVRFCPFCGWECKR